MGPQDVETLGSDRVGHQYERQAHGAYYKQTLCGPARALEACLAAYTDSPPIVIQLANDGRRWRPRGA